ncbi:MAG TPA: pyridoxamine 5'-phosphate oxidase [Acidimicrobiales bacterium]|nr:pyridoxamine 5'-phosphate oxidase [Acidimicrobiales bacterium]
MAERLGRHPFRELAAWMDEARAVQPFWADAMVLATTDESGAPAARAVLLRGLDERGLVFYTDGESRKGRELARDPRAALVFLWPSHERQVRVEGVVQPVGEEEVDAYWAGRPRGSQLSAWASHQSEVVSGRDVLEKAVAELSERFGDGPVPRPPRWAGFRLVPSAFEFWQGRPDRLHDRLRYRLDGRGQWLTERLAP